VDAANRPVSQYNWVIEHSKQSDIEPLHMQISEAQSAIELRSSTQCRKIYGHTDSTFVPAEPCIKLSTLRL